MATKIQLRRDTSANWQGTNPILAQGEPGVELDTKKMKVGDGISAWNDLEYVAGGTEENSTTNMFVKIDGLDNQLGPDAAGVISVSTDGLNWTPSAYNQLFTDWEAWDIFHVAVGNGRIVYHTYEYASNVDGLRWAYNPFDKPNRPTSDESRMGPHGEDISWRNVRYVGGKFLAVGTYYDNDRDDYNYPIAAYSTDGDMWTRININLTYVNGLIQAERDAHSNDVDGLILTDVAYGDNGWLFVMHWGPFDNSGGQNNFANAFYVTNLTTQLGSANYVTGIPGSYTVKYDGKGWVTWSDYDPLTSNGSILYINSSSDPRAGSWTPTDIDTVAMQLTGVIVGGITDVVAGTVNNEHWIMVGTDHHGAFASKDQGASWKFLQTGARTYHIYNVSDTNPAYLLSGEGYLSDDTGEKVTIIGSTISQLNGTFYVRYYDGPNGFHSYLYSAYDPNTDTFSGPLDATSWGDVVVEVDVYANVTYGFNTFQTNSAMDLRVGMVAEGYDGFTTLEDSNSMSDPNVITAINNDMVTMKYPWHFSNTSTTLYFRPILYNTYGDGITSMAYGDGAFIGFSSNDGSRSYRTTDVNSWTRTSRGNAAQFGPWGNNYLNSVAYGEVTTPASTLINNSETIPGYASYLTVGDTFTVNVSGGDPEWTDSPLAEGFSTGGIMIDPALSIWSIGVIQDVEGWDSTNTLGIGTYQDNGNWFGNHRHDSIRVETTEGWSWRFSDTEGYFETHNLNVEGYNNMYMYTSEGEITINAPFDGYSGPGSNGEGYAQLTWGDVVNSVKVDWYGTYINTEGYTWHFTDDCNGDDWGILYQPDSAGIQTGGYWWIGDYQSNYSNGNSHTFIQGTSWSNTYPTDLLFSAEGYDGDAVYVMDRYGTLEVVYGDGVFQSTGNWAIGDYKNDDSYTYIGANANVINADPFDIIVSADNTAWYFNRTGTLQLPVGGDIVDDNGDSVLIRNLPQTLHENDQDYTLLLTDSGRHIYNIDTGNILIPKDADVDFPIGSVVVIINGAGISNTLAAAYPLVTTVLVNDIGIAVNPISINQGSWVTIIKVAANTWVVKS